MSPIRRVSNVLFAIGQAAVPALGAAGLYGKTVDAEFQTTTTPVVPAGYAFAIWGLIFLLSLAYSIDQARPARANDRLYQQVGWLTAAAFAANTVWSLIAQQDGPLILTGLTFLVSLFTILPAASLVFDPAHRGDSKHLLLKLAVGTLAGWVTVAVFANWSVIFQDLGLGSIPSREVQALLLLSAAGATAAFMIRRTRGAIPYVATIAWALVAVIIANVKGELPSVAIGAGLWLSVLGALAWIVRRRHSDVHA